MQRDRLEQAEEKNGAVVKQEQTESLNLLDPITQEFIVKAVIVATTLPDGRHVGHIFDDTSIRKWIAYQKEQDERPFNPINRVKITKNSILYCDTLQQIMQENRDLANKAQQQAKQISVLEEKLKLTQPAVKPSPRSQFFASPQQKKPILTAEQQQKINQQLFDTLKEADAIEIVRLLEQGAELEAIDPKTGLTPLSTAIKYSLNPLLKTDPDFHIPELLVTLGANINARTTRVDPHFRYQKNSTPLMILITYHHSFVTLPPTQRKFFQILYGRKVDINAQDELGQTAYQVAVKCKSRPWLRMLNDYRIDVRLPNKQGRNGYEFAVSEEHYPADLITLLKEDLQLSEDQLGKYAPVVAANPLRLM